MSRIIAIIILACTLCSATAQAQSYSMSMSAMKADVQRLSEASENFISSRGAQTFDGDLAVTGDMTISGHVYEHQCRVYAYLTAPSNTTVATAGAYVPVLGVFTNSTLDGFGLGSVSNAPAIVYTNAYAGEFEAHISAEVQCSANGTRATVALRVGGAVDPESSMSVYIKAAGEPQNVHFMATPALTNGSTVQLVCTSDGDGDVLTFNQFKASIKRFR